MKLNNMKLHGQLIANPNDKATYERYVREIMKYKPLSREEELRLFIEYKETGDVRIREKICRHNLLFVVSVAKRYAMLIPYSAITFEDLISEGNYGIMQAVDRFDLTTGNKFISYAVWWIRQSVISCIQNHYKNIRLPINVKSFITKIEKEENRLQQLLGRDISSIELFNSMLEKGEFTLESSAHEIDELYKMNAFEVSLNKPIRIDKGGRSDDGMEMIDIIASEENSPYQSLEIKERENIAMGMLDKLPKKIQNYFIDYFGLLGHPPMKFSELGIKYECSSTTIKNNITKYLRKMRVTNRDIGGHLFPSTSFKTKREAEDSKIIYIN